MLSSIVQQFDLPTNRLYQIRDDLMRRRVKLVDLVSGNVNAQGIIFPAALLKKAMASGLRAGKIYGPNPLGQPEARKAISNLYSSEKMKVPPEQILLTPGTSLSYWYAFKLLADLGDEILAPVPSYPLFDSIAALSGIKLVPYRLRESARWDIDFNDLQAAITPRTKAIVLVSPHNPTGAVATEEEVKKLAEIAAAHGLGIISDEVFSPFLNGREKLPRPASTSAPLVLTLNGLSKMLALPGMKIGWMAVTGEARWVEKAMKTLEMISDTFLPVNEPAQLALAEILGSGGTFQKAYVRKIQVRAKTALEVLATSEKLSFIRPEGGFFLTARLEKAGVDAEEIACRLLQKHHILIHPGFFYDLDDQHLVFSLVNRRDVLRTSIKTILRELT